MKNEIRAQNEGCTYLDLRTVVFLVEIGLVLFIVLLKLEVDSISDLFYLILN